LFFNPGSVGRVIDRNAAATGGDHAHPWAEYSVVTSDERGIGIEFRQVAIDLERLGASIRASGMPFTDLMLARFGLN
jgi:hypothetical protein